MEIKRTVQITLVALFIVGCLTLFMVTQPLPAGAQNATHTPVPLITLVPPTLMPPAPTATVSGSLTQSALARIKARINPNSTDKRPSLIVGIPYNVYRFDLLSDSGEVQGFEADIAAAIADDWGTQIQFKQVTSENSHTLLMNGDIDLLMGQVVLSRDTQMDMDYSDPFFANREVGLVLNESSAKDIPDISGQNVGVVVGSPAEQAYADWATASGVKATVKQYPMLDQALHGLLNKDIDVLIGDRWELDKHVAGIVQGVRLLPSPFLVEPYAIAMRRYDDNLRTLVNRTLQRLEQSGRLDPIYDQWFAKGDLLPQDRLEPTIWSGLAGDTRSLSDFATDIVMPANPVILRLQGKQALRVAGLGAPPDENGNTSPLEAFNEAVVNELARRWGVSVQNIPDSYGKGEDLLASGQADIAIGIEPHWSSVDRVDFTTIYADHAYRLMIPYGSTMVKSFSDLFATRRQIGYFSDDPNVVDLIKQTAQKVNIPVDTLRLIKLQTDDDVLQGLVGDHTLNVVFGDSLRLMPIVTANPKSVELTDTEYTPRPVSFAVPRNDADFRVLLDVTMQQMYEDGTYQKLWKADFNLGDPLTLTVWPGSSTMFGIKTAG